MTAVTATRAGIGRRPAPAAGPRRLLNVARLQTVAWRTGLVWPWIILAIAFAVNLLLFTAMDARGVEEKTTGGLSSIYFVMSFVAYATVTKDFPFALSMGVTRRTFFLGAAAFAIVQAMVYGAVIGLLRMAEVATGGWGIELNFFAPVFLQVDDPAQQWLIYVVPFLVVAATGQALGLVAKRWSVNGILALIAGLTAAVGLFATLATLWEWWGPIGTWFADSSLTALWAGWPALGAVLLAGLTYLGLRRATA